MGESESTPPVSERTLQRQGTNGWAILRAVATPVSDSKSNLMQWPSPRRFVCNGESLKQTFARLTKLYSTAATIRMSLWPPWMATK